MMTWDELKEDASPDIVARFNQLEMAGITPEALVRAFLEHLPELPPEAWAELEGCGIIPAEAWRELRATCRKND
jgi:hypothetical protein